MNSLDLPVKIMISGEIFFFLVFALSSLFLWAYNRSIGQRLSLIDILGGFTVPIYALVSCGVMLLMILIYLMIGAVYSVIFS